MPVSATGLLHPVIEAVRNANMQAFSSPHRALHRNWTPAAGVLSLLANPNSWLRVNAPRAPLPAAPTDVGREAQLADLLQAAAQGDARAFETFYNLTIGVTTAVVRRIAGDRYAEDVLADTYFQAWRDAHRFEPQRGNPLGWLLALARSRALDRLRAEALRHPRPGGTARGNEDAGPDDPAPGPDTLLESLQTHARLHAALAGLSSSERWVIGLAYYRELSHSEIAALTDLPLGTVKSLILRAQHKLRADFQPAMAAGNAAPGHAP